jgi:hypothetical protein
MAWRLLPEVVIREVEDRASPSIWVAGARIDCLRRNVFQRLYADMKVAGHRRDHPEPSVGSKGNGWFA